MIESAPGEMLCGGEMMRGQRRARSSLLMWLVVAAMLMPFCCIYAYGLGTGKQLRDYRRQSWQNDNGLPQNTVYSVVQTRDGFLWLATEGGLVRFDGVDFRVFDTANTPQLRSNFVNGLMEDASGVLWISTADGLLCLRDGKFSTFTTDEGLPSNTVLSVYQRRDGGLIAVTAAGLAAAEDGHFQSIVGAGLLANADGTSLITEDARGTVWVAGDRQLLSIAADSRSVNQTIPLADLGTIQAISANATGSLWVGGRDGLVYFSGGKRTRFSVDTGLPSENITALLPDSAGNMWIGTGDGLALYSKGSIKQVGAHDGLGGVRVQKLFLDRAGALWVAFDHGLARLVDGKVDIAPQQTVVNGVLSVFEDREGSMWFGTDTGGLDVLRDQTFSTITAQDGLSGDFVRALFQDHSGAIWIGTNSGGLDKFAGGKITALGSNVGLPSNVVLALAETGTGADHDLWVGTPDGLGRLRDGRARMYSAADGMADNFVRSLFADTDGSLWVGTRNGLSRFSGGKFTSYSRLDGLGSDVIGAMLRARNGDLWISTLGGLSRFNGSGFTNFTSRNGLGSDAVTSLFEDAEGTLWIGTNGGGISRLRNGVFTALPPGKSGLPETVYGILEDDKKNLWLSSKKGIYRVSIAALNAYADKRGNELGIRIYGVADGMRISECSSGGHPAAWRMQDGTLWFATLKGATSVNPRSEFDNNLPPQTAIIQAVVDDQPVDARTFFKVQPGHERITIHYAGLSFVAPQKVRYRYILQGFDRGWVEAGGSRTAYYTNVPPGTYQFKVISSNNDGVWSTEPAALEFKVEPRFTQTMWFYGLIGVLLVALGYAIYRVRVRYVEAEYQAVMAERGRIAREVHDTLAQGYVGISVQLELTARLLQTSKEAALNQLNQTKELVRSSLAEARSSIWNLRAQGEDAEILPARLAASAKARQQSDGPSIGVQIRGTYQPLNRKVEDEILRIAQESINNAVRHAKARHIGVTLTYDATKVQLQVVDDGTGFQQPVESFVSQGHFGLQGMRERAAGIKAAFNVKSEPGKGTTVVLELKMLQAVGKGEA
jgi:ligand-binding sensor domain-containing protein/signal transduction histidine kinase